MRRGGQEYGKRQKWGIWNRKRCVFQFGICEDSPGRARARLRELIGDDAFKYRFEVRPIPGFQGAPKGGGRL